MSYVKPSDFEDMMRPIARAMLDQGWHLKRTASGHVKCVPPKGPPIIVSVTNKAFKPNIRLLREGGLVIPNDEQEKQEVIESEFTKGIEIDAKVEPNPDFKPEAKPPKERKKVLPRGSVQNAVMNFFQSHGGTGITYSLDDVLTHVRGQLPGVTREVISTTCSQNAASGKLVRMGKGIYRYAQQDRRTSDKESLSAEEQQMLEEDEKILNNFLDALAQLQEWAERMRKMSIQFNRMKKMLEGLKLQ